MLRRAQRYFIETVLLNIFSRTILPTLFFSDINNFTYLLTYIINLIKEGLWFLPVRRTLSFSLCLITLVVHLLFQCRTLELGMPSFQQAVLDFVFGHGRKFNI